jgi:tRNA A37 threonylcarbamoyltransferase TsaD
MALKRAFSVSGLVSQEEMNIQRLEDRENKSSQDKVDKLSTEEKKQTVSKSNNGKVKKLTAREKEIKNLVNGDVKLRKDLFEYLEHVKKMKEVDKISINDLSNK